MRNQWDGHGQLGFIHRRQNTVGEAIPIEDKLQTLCKVEKASTGSASTMFRSHLSGPCFRAHPLSTARGVRKSMNKIDL